jgi:DNA-directed RNA polymerase specialized sigma24 family protein
MSAVTRIPGQSQCSRMMIASQKGDQHAYRQLLMKVASLVEAIAVYQGFNAAATDTLIADVLKTVNAIRHTYHPSQEFSRWLIGIVCFKMKQYQKQHRSNCGCTTPIEGVSKVLSNLNGGSKIESAETEAMV